MIVVSVEQEVPCEPPTRTSVQIKQAEHFRHPEETPIRDWEVYNSASSIDAETARVGREAMMQHDAVKERRQNLDRKSRPHWYVTHFSLIVVWRRSHHVDILRQEGVSL